MKKGLVMEGGAMRGLFTAGVIDVLMEHGVEFDGAVGVSAGAAFGCNYKSKQIKRVIGYISKYCNDDRFCSWKSWWKTGDLYGAKFGYETLPNELAFFDRETFKNNPMEFWVVATDVETGKAVYKRLDAASDAEIRWMTASASMPLVSNIQEMEGYKLLDGGMADSIPIRFFEDLGYDRNVVILTQPLDFVKKKNPLMWLIRIVMHKYPALVKVMAERQGFYNATTKYIREQELAGKLFVIRPPAALGVGGVEHDRTKLERVYEIGRKEAEKQIAALQSFLAHKD